MTRRLLLIMVLCAACFVPDLSSAAARPAKSAKRHAAPAHRAARPAKQPVAAAAPDSAAALAAGPRKLEDIHIEGEIPAPQVLFVTARDQRRFTRFHHQRYLKNSLQVGETTQLPTRVALTHPPTSAGAP